MQEHNAIQIKSKIAELETAILSAHPTLPSILQTIHRILKEDASNITLLSESEIGIIVSGLKKQTMTEITAGALKKKVSLKNTSLADL